MGTMIDVYIRIREGITSEQIRIFPNYPREIEASFIRFELPVSESDPKEGELARISEELGTDIYFLCFQSAVDAFQYFHWSNGVLVRALVYGCEEERVWERANGSTEPWEEAVFFSEEAYQELLESYESEERDELTHIWTNRLLEPGQFEPRLNARESCRTIAEYYGFPGWE